MKEAKTKTKKVDKKVLKNEEKEVKKEIKKVDKKTTKKAEPKKVVKKVKEKKAPKESYLHEVKTEMKKVKWPSFKELAKYSIATVLLCLILALYFQGLDYLSSTILKLING